MQTRSAVTDVVQPPSLCGDVTVQCVEVAFCPTLYAWQGVLMMGLQIVNGEQSYRVHPSRQSW